MQTTVSEDTSVATEDTGKSVTQTLARLDALWSFFKVSSSLANVDGLPRRCRSKYILGVRKIFAQISPNLPEKFMCEFCLQIFSHKDHDDFFRVTCTKKVFIYFCKPLGAIFAQIFRDFA